MSLLFISFCMVSVRYITELSMSSFIVILWLILKLLLSEALNSTCLHVGNILADVCCYVNITGRWSEVRSVTVVELAMSMFFWKYPTIGDIGSLTLYRVESWGSLTYKSRYKDRFMSICPTLFAVSLHELRRRNQTNLGIICSDCVI